MVHRGADEPHRDAPASHVPLPPCEPSGSISDRRSGPISTPYALQGPTFCLPFTADHCRARCLYFVRRRADVSFGWLFWMFSAFIFLCGTTHVFQIWTVWEPMYRLEGLVKLLTAVVSGVTAIVLRPSVPKALAIPSPGQLARANDELRREIEERKRAEAQLEQMRADLEREVRERTSDVLRSNEALQHFASFVSHELRQPLGAMSIWIVLDQEDGDHRAGHLALRTRARGGSRRNARSWRRTDYPPLYAYRRL